jgi:hypothetical protein
MDTCRSCVHRTVLPNPQTKELTSYCTRNPPHALGIATAQGVALVTVYPAISPEWASCGELELPEEDAVLSA